MSTTGGYYKIVQTINNGKSELSAVPSRWEENGILHWPTKAAGAAGLLSLKDPNSIPGVKGWSRYKCSVKRPNVKWDLETAEKEITDMLEKTDTSASSSSECDLMPPPIPKNRLKRRTTSTIVSNAETDRNNFNDEALAMTTKNYESEILRTNQFSQLLSHQPPIYVPQETNKPFFVANTTWTPPAVNATDGVNLCNITAILETVSKNLIILNKKVDYLNKKVDKLIEKIDNHQSKPPSADSTSLKTAMHPIQTVEDLSEFESKLKTNKDFANNLIEKLKDVCGENSMKGDNAAYTLVDVIFSRKLMTELSWAGGVKKGGTPKKAFKEFEHVLNFFHTLVKKSDATYTEVEAKNFFKKKVLPNSVRRSIAPMVRASQPKSRGKHSKHQSKIKDKYDIEVVDPAFCEDNLNCTTSTNDADDEEPEPVAVNYEETYPKESITKNSNRYDDGCYGDYEDGTKTEEEDCEGFINNFCEEFLVEEEEILPPVKRMRLRDGW